MAEKVRALLQAPPQGGLEVQEHLILELHVCIYIACILPPKTGLKEKKIVLSGVRQFGMQASMSASHAGLNRYQTQERREVNEQEHKV